MTEVGLSYPSLTEAGHIKHALILYTNGYISILEGNHLGV